MSGAERFSRPLPGFHLWVAGCRDTGAAQYRGGEPAGPCGDAEHVESQGAGGQSVSTNRDGGAELTR